MNGEQVWTCKECGEVNLVEHKACQKCGADRHPFQPRWPSEQDARQSHGPTEAERRQKHRKDRRQHGPR